MHTQVLSGCMLFGGLDYASVTHRVAFGQGPNLQLTAEERAALGEATHPTASAAATAAAADRGTQGVTAPASCSSDRSAAGHGGQTAVGGESAALVHGGRQPQEPQTQQRKPGSIGSELGNFVEWVLARDPASRPGLVEVHTRLQGLRAQALALCEARP